MKPHADFFAFRRFRLELDGIAQGAFAGFDPPGRRAEPDPEGTGLVLRRVPARLLSGVANTRELLGWFQPALGGEPLRRVVTVVELGDDGAPVARHRLEGAWPTRVRLATLTTDVYFEVEAVELDVLGWGREEIDAGAGETPPGGPPPAEAA